MWSLPGALDRRSASMLGVGHFAVPADVSVEPAGSGRSSHRVDEPRDTIRTIVVPHGITAVPRRSPIKVAKRTPWRPSPEHTVTPRGGSREWFTDRLFVESKQANLPAACCTSAMAHAAGVAIIALLLLTARAMPSHPMPRSGMDVSLRMPPIELLLPIAVAPPNVPTPVRSLPVTAVRKAPAAARVMEAAPRETLSSIKAEPEASGDAPIATEPIAAAPIAAPISAAPIAAAPSGDGGGATDGAAGSVAVNADPVAPPAATGPLAVGDGIERPRKIKDVRPVYPPMAMSARVGGNVVIEATIGVDGKVRNARVLRSISLLDQAALEAVRQWEFEPSRINGGAVAVTMVIVVTFALL
jgi:periplasmic protein TonB